MAIDKKSIKKIFPHLYEELENGEVKVPINAVRKNPLEAEEEAVVAKLAKNVTALKKSLHPTQKRLINCVILTLPQ